MLLLMGAPEDSVVCAQRDARLLRASSPFVDALKVATESLLQIRN